MNLILRNARIIDRESAFYNKVNDVMIKNGKIESIAEKIPKTSGYEEITLNNLHISKGWFDSSVSFGEPGFEDRETILNGLETAAKSGYSAVALQPNSFPVTDSQSQVNFIKSRACGTGVDLYPIGALTKGSDGKDLAELFDMKRAGAIAFGDYNKNIDNSNLLKIALQYTQDFDGLVIAFCHDKYVAGNGVANEGNSATKLGLKGIPGLAEELMVARNLHILEYTGGKMHIPTVSTQKSVDLIKSAKKKGLQVTCSVTVHQLLMSDEKLGGFDTRFKVLPPLRDEDTRKSLLKAVTDGTIDMITSDHNPIDIEHKKMEFDLALNGTIGLESAFGALMTVLPMETVVEKLTAGKNIFGIAAPETVKNSDANFTLFNPDGRWTFEKDIILSKSKNSAFLGMPMKGKVYGIYNHGRLVLK